MVDREIIVKTFDSILLKCSPSDNIRKIGKNVNVAEYTNDKNETVTRYDYGDGISVEVTNAVKHISEVGSDYEYDVETPVFTSINFNGKEYPILSKHGERDDGTDSFFNYQKDEILNRYGEDGWEFYKEYANNFATYKGWELNSILRGEHSVDDFTDDEDSISSIRFLVDNHDRFVDMEQHLSLDRDDFVSIRIMGDLHRNDSVGKKIVQDKGHTSTSVVGDVYHYDAYANPDDSWFVFTLNDKGSGVKGGYLGSAIDEGYGDDFEREVNYVPGQRFERLVIDDEHKFIIQRPLPLGE